MNVGGRIPQRVVDAVQDAGEIARAMAQQSVEAHAARRRTDFRRIRRRYGRDAIGQLEPGLQIADRAVIFDAVDRIRVPRQTERIQQVAAELALERQVVHGHHGAGARPSRIVQIRRRETRLPVVRVHDIGNELRDCAMANGRRGMRKRGETKRVVAPHVAARVRVGTAIARIEMRCVEHEPIAIAHVRRKHARRPAMQIAERVHRRRIANRRHHRRIAREQRAHGDVLGSERRGQRADDVGETAGLDQRKRFRGDGENAQATQLRALNFAEAVQHRLRDEADAALGATKARGIELRIVADDETRRNAHAGVDDDVA